MNTMTENLETISLGEREAVVANTEASSLVAGHQPSAELLAGAAAVGILAGPFVYLAGLGLVRAIRNHFVEPN